MDGRKSRNNSKKNPRQKKYITQSMRMKIIAQYRTYSQRPLERPKSPVFPEFWRYSLISDAFAAAFIDRLDYELLFDMLYYAKKEKVEDLLKVEDDIEEKKALVDGMSCVRSIKKMKR
ncbi:hypothetical protein NECAME_16985 [Necator americanus]|uniref:Uncharacterized protein n=1 Tax=Necator americanus TaxID=51031 RepID=W2TUU1_NECAM|nr:hypothetical protein NECAME_16985 [Necator americanus]ETN84831.1 hypothetical protein NECAME_16985 [Necator americanus]